MRLHPPSLKLRRTGRSHLLTQGWPARRSLGEVGYNNKMRGQLAKREAAAAQAEMPSNAIEVINVAEYNPCRIPSAKWRELIKKVWLVLRSEGSLRLLRRVAEADPLLCPRCGKEMRIVALIDQRGVIEKILRHLGLWEQGVRVIPATGPPASAPALESREHIIEPWLDDPAPDYDTDVMYANG